MDTYSLNDIQIVVREAPIVPAEIKPFVGAPFHNAGQVYERFRQLSTLPVETFIAVHLSGKNSMIGMTTCSIGCLNSSLAHPREIFRPERS